MRNSDEPRIEVTKASGERSHYDRDKLIQSLHRSGASDDAIESVVADVESTLVDGMSTHKIYRRAFQLLKKSSVVAASQYKLKSAVMELGPSGYPFEQFVGALFRASGWTSKVGVIMPGQCVTHEVDVFAKKEGIVRFVECKFRNMPGSKVDVKVPLYVNSRVRDLIARYAKDHQEERIIGYQGWVVTNSKFTEDAERYGECEGMHLLAWDYPQGRGLIDLIRTTGLLPVTVLHSLSSKQKEAVMSNDVVICRDLFARMEVLFELGIEQSVRNRVNEELRAILGA
jgi:Holliday junction resolvase-like predicted endonuclease